MLRFLCSRDLEMHLEILDEVIFDIRDSQSKGSEEITRTVLRAAIASQQCSSQSVAF
jgi:hypothetical protein